MYVPYCSANENLGAVLLSQRELRSRFLPASLYEAYNTFALIRVQVLVSSLYLIRIPIIEYVQKHEHRDFPLVGSSHQLFIRSLIIPIGSLLSRGGARTLE